MAGGQSQEAQSGRIELGNPPNCQQPSGSHRKIPNEPGWWCNNHIEKYYIVNGKDDIPYMMENKIHV